MVTGAPLRPTHLSLSDVARLGSTGLRSRPLRAALSGLGIAIGVAAMIAVVGISNSSREQVNRQLDRLGTNLLRVTPARDLAGHQTELPTQAPAMVARIPPVLAAAATGELSVSVYRNNLIPSGRTNSLSVLAADHGLLRAVGGHVVVGRWLGQVDPSYPSVVLGAVAAQRLDVWTPGTRVWIGDQWAGVVGVLDPVELAPELDTSALVSWPVAEHYFGSDGHASTIYVRAVQSQVLPVAAVLAPTASPSSPGDVLVERPSDAIAARSVTDTTFTGLLLGLGSVALLVGGIGVANIMVISVLERRTEIGLRRALGATRRQIRGQFIAESLLLAGVGGAAGCLLGALVTAAYAEQRAWPTVVPAWASFGGVLVTFAVGGIAGLYPAVRASRLPPTDALGTP
jgi:putative ABC transport system permease protein